MTEAATPPIERELERAGLPDLHRYAWLEIDLAALVHNARVLRSLAGPGVRLALAAKANAYGHGLEVSSWAGVGGGADCLILGTFDEAMRLRDFGLQAGLLVVYPVARDAVGEAAVRGVDLAASNSEATGALLAAWRAVMPKLGGCELRLHLEVDSGFTRGGVSPDGVVDTARAILAEPGVRLAGVWSHLARSSDPESARRQVERYEAALAALGAAGIEPRLRHMAASSGLLGGTSPPYDMVRIGLAYYGEREPDLRPDTPEAAAAAAALRPAVTLKARAVRIEEIARGERVGYGGAWEAPRTSLIATLPLGYGDGYVRAYSPGASVLIRGKRAPVVGRVSMDSLAVDVTDVPGASLDDDVVLIGPQGDGRITLDELAATRSSVNYEVIVGLGERLARVYRDASEIVAVSRPGSTVVVSPTASERWSTGSLAGRRRG